MYVTLVPRGNEMLRLGARLPAFLPAQASFTEADSKFKAIQTSVYVKGLYMYLNTRQAL